MVSLIMEHLRQFHRLRHLPCRRTEVDGIFETNLCRRVYAEVRGGWKSFPRPLETGAPGSIAPGLSWRGNAALGWRRGLGCRVSRQGRHVRRLARRLESPFSESSGC